MGLLGFSQGGWVALLAAKRRDPDFVVSLSGPGVTPAVQDRDRIERALRSKGLDRDAVVEALAWIDERTRRLLAGEAVGDVLADQHRLADRSWYATTTEYFDNLPALSFLGRLLDFDPVPVASACHVSRARALRRRGPIVPVAPSVTAFAANLPALPGDPHGIAVFPGADHGLFTADPDPAIPRTDQLAPGFLPMVAGFVAGIGAASQTS